MTRIVFVNRFYWPQTPATGQLLTDLAEGLAQSGWTVTVITGGGPDTAAQETRHGVEIVRVPGFEHGTSAASKLAAFVRFGSGALVAALRRVRRNDIVVCLTDPPLLGVGIALTAGWRGARLIHWAHDIYPEVAVAVSGHRGFNLLRPLRNLAWRSAERVVTLGPRMAALVEAGGVAPARVRTVPNWAPAGLAPRPLHDGAVADLRRQWGLEGRRVVAYSGNLGRVHDLDSILRVADALRAERDIAFVFIGAGAQGAKLQQRVAAAGLPNVSFQPAQPRAQLAVSLSVADVHLVTLKPGCEAVVYPSKLYGIAAVGRPVVFLGPVDSDIAATVRDRGLGLTLDGRDAGSAASALSAFLRDEAARAAAGRSALAFAAATSFDHSRSTWNRLLAEIANPLPAPASRA